MTYGLNVFRVYVLRKESIPDNVTLHNLYIFNMAGILFIATLYEKLLYVKLR